MILSGELFDLTLTSLNNPFGYEKIKYSIQHGVSLPIEKYIDELQSIVKTKKDDKTEKRKKRLEFLQLCATYENIRLLFTYMCTYINGRNDSNDLNDYKSITIFIVAGGNIITIFAKLLVEIYNCKNKNMCNIHFLTLLEENYFNALQQEIKNIFEPNTKKVIELSTKSNAEIIIELSTKSYSDFDYNLVMNKPPTNISFNLANHPFVDSKNQGFILLRAKSKIVCNTDDTNINPMKRGEKHPCDEIFDTRTLFPQTAQINMLEHEKITPECKKYIEYLLEKKRRIEKETNKNIETTINTYKDGIKDPHTRIYTLDQHHNELNAIIEYLHSVTNKMNIHIQTWEDGKYNCFEGCGFKNKKWIDVFNDFQTLESLLKSNELLTLSVDIINLFLNDPTFNTETILDNLIKNNKDCRMDPSTLQIAPNKEIIDKFRFMKRRLQKQRFSELGFPDGIHITLNAIYTTDEELNEIPDLNTKEIELNDTRDSVCSTSKCSRKRTLSLSRSKSRSRSRSRSREGIRLRGRHNIKSQKNENKSGVKRKKKKKTKRKQKKKK